MILERDVEQRLVRGIESAGGKCIKVGTDGLPDRECILPHGRTIWCEIKRPGGTASKLQEYNVAEMRKLGHDARFLRSAEEVDLLLMEIRE